MKGRRKKPSLLTRLRVGLIWWIRDVKNSRRNADAAYSARYILEDMYNEKGIQAVSELTGLPEGVIVSAFKNIFHE